MSGSRPRLPLLTAFCFALPPRPRLSLPSPPLPAQAPARSAALKVLAIKDGATLDRKLRVAVIGGGPSGACCAESLAAGGVEAFLFERKMDNCKPCGGAIPICMVEEFDLPMEIIDRRVTKMKMISPSNREVDVGQTRAWPLRRRRLC